MNAVAEPRIRALDPFVDRIVFSHEPRTVELAASGGVPLAASVYLPPGGADPSRVVIINSATAVKRRYYASFAAFLSDRGFTVVTYDYRGIGGSRPKTLRGFSARMRHWGERDFAAVLDWVESELGCASPLVVGHSAGGQIVGLAANNERIKGLLLVGAQSGDFRLWPMAKRARMALIWYALVPAMTAAWGYLPGATLGGEDLPSGVAREWASWARRPGYLAGGSDTSRIDGFARLRVPLLAYSISDDGYAPPQAVAALLALFAGAAKTVRHVSPGDVGRRTFGHFGFFRRGVAGSLWEEAAEWLETTNARASGTQAAIAPAAPVARALRGN